MRRAAPVLLLAALVSSCSGPPWRDVRATILDEAGTPVAGAVFYAEVYDSAGPFAFLSAVSGTAGEVPDNAREALSLPWRRGAGIALAVMAEGYLPEVRREDSGPVVSDGALFVLRRAEEPAAWDPALAELAFPFPDRPDLAARAAAPEHIPLRAALRSAWQTRKNLPHPLSPAEKRKFSAIDASG